MWWAWVFLFACKGGSERDLRQKTRSFAILVLTLLLLCGCRGNPLPVGMEEETLLKHGREAAVLLASGDYEEVLDRMREDVRRDLSYMTYAPILFISAATGQRVDRLFELIRRPAAVLLVGLNHQGGVPMLEQGLGQVKTHLARSYNNDLQRKHPSLNQSCAEDAVPFFQLVAAGLLVEDEGAIPAQHPHDAFVLAAPHLGDGLPPVVRGHRQGGKA